MTETLLLKPIEDTNEHVWQVSLNRPEVHNAINLDMFKDIEIICQQIEDNPKIRVIVLTGEGKSFCSGLDKSMFAMFKPGSSMFEMEGVPGTPNLYQKASLLWRNLSVPVIAALKGATIGGGLQIALGADIRVAEPETKFSIREIDWGIIPDMGTSISLRQQVNLDMIKWLMMTGDTIDTDLAKEIGLCTFIDEQAEQKAIEIAKTIAQRNPDAVKSIKQMLHQNLLNDVNEALDYEQAEQEKLIGSKNQLEAVFAKIQKREANFE